MRETLTDILATEGYDVASASSGPEGLARFRDDPRDVVLLDIGLPGLDGLELARAIRSHESGRSTRLLALTGYGDDQSAEAVRAAGFDGHLVKPVALEELFDALRDAQATQNGAGPLQRQPSR